MSTSSEKRLQALEESFEEEVDRRLVEELEDVFHILADHLPPETFLEVARVLNSEDPGGTPRGGHSR